MKKRTLLLVISLGLALLVLAACGLKKADLQGKWYVQDATGQNATINFSDKSFTMDGDEQGYKVTGKGFENSVRYLLVKIDGDDYTVAFLEKDKKTSALIKTDGDKPLKGRIALFLSKSEKPDYEKYAKKYKDKLGIV